MFNYAYDEAAIVRELDIEDLDAADQQHMLQRIRQILQERMGIRIEMNLSPDELEAFSKLGTDKPAAQAFLLQRFPDMTDMYAEELEIIVQQLKNGLQ